MAYTKVDWDENTDVDAANLDQMDQGIKDNADRVDDHSSRHEEDGADELSVEGLSGDLADRQDPKNHADRHEKGGADEISLTNKSDWGDLDVARSDVTSSNWGDYEIQKDGSDGSGVINFKT